MAGICGKMGALYTAINYQRNENKNKNGRGSKNEPNGEQSRKPIDVTPQCVRGHYDHSQYNTGDIDSCSYVLGIIETLDLDFTD